MQNFVTSEYDFHSNNYQDAYYNVRILPQLMSYFNYYTYLQEHPFKE